MVPELEDAVGDTLIQDDELATDQFTFDETVAELLPLDGPKAMVCLSTLRKLELPDPPEFTKEQGLQTPPQSTAVSF